MVTLLVGLITKFISNSEGVYFKIYQYSEIK